MANIQGPIGNYYDKFNTTNPIARKLMQGFIHTFLELFEQTDAQTILEIGCGEGEMLNIMQVKPEIQLHGFDVDVPMLAQAQERFPSIPLTVMDGHHIAYRDQAFDLVIACEVLEHVAHPARVLAEAKRMSCQFAIFSVPREPIWRVLNFARGKYLSDFGNTPGHIQHWSTNSFIAQVSEHFEVIEVRQPLPWTMVLCRIR
ncbi:MAG: class I SAM-dependent methyltransferase [Anaerolineae bacterium]